MKNQFLLLLLSVCLTLPAQVAVDVDSSQFPELQDALVLGSYGEFFATYKTGLTSIYRRTVQVGPNGTVKGSLKLLVRDDNPAFAADEKIGYYGPSSATTTTLKAPVLLFNERTGKMYFTTFLGIKTAGFQRVWTYDLGTGRLERILAVGDQVGYKLLATLPGAADNLAQVDTLNSTVYPSLEGDRLFVAVDLRIPRPGSTSPFGQRSIFELKRDAAGKVTLVEILYLPHQPVDVETVNEEGLWFTSPTKFVIGIGPSSYSTGPQAPVVPYSGRRLENMDLFTGKRTVLIQNNQKFGGDTVSSWNLLVNPRSYELHVLYQTTTGVQKFAKLTPEGQPIVITTTERVFENWGRVERIYSVGFGRNSGLISFKLASDIYGWALWNYTDSTVVPVVRTGDRLSNGGEVMGTPVGGGLYQIGGPPDNFLTRYNISQGYRIGWYAILPATPVSPPAVTALTSVFINALSPPKTTFAPYEIVTLWGKEMCESTAATQQVSQLPAELAGYKVLVDNAPARLYFVSPTQINLQLPPLSPGGHQLAVQNGRQVVSGPFQFRVEPASPSFVTNPQNYVYLQKVDGSFVARENPARPGETLVVYGTGLGLTTPEVPYGSAGVIASVNVPVKVMTNGEESEVLYAGTTWEFPGLYQINFTVPAGTLPDELGLTWLELKVGSTSTVFRFNLSVP